MTSPNADPFALATVTDVDSFDAPPTPGSKTACPYCGKLYHVNADGSLRSHKCVNDVPGARGLGRARTPQKAPKPVYDLAVPLLAGSVEWGAGHFLARSIPTSYDRARNAADMGENADALLGPIVQSIWPELPKGAQKALQRIADHSDLIACAFAWSDYVSELRQFAAQERVTVMQENGIQEGGVANDFDSGPAFTTPGLRPFSPAAD